MDALFRKKRSRQPNELDRSLHQSPGAHNGQGVFDRSSIVTTPGRSSHGWGPGSSSATSPPLSISGPSSNPHVSKDGRGPSFLGPFTSGDSPISSRYSASTVAGSSMRGSDLTGPSYDSASSYTNGAASRSSRFTSSSSNTESSGVMTASAHDILNRMSLSAASAASVGVPWGSHDQTTASPATPHYQHSSPLPPAPSGPRQSSASASYHNGPANQRSPAGGEFVLPRPADVEVEKMFAELMDRRDFIGGNMADKDGMRRNMLMFNVDKKWALVYNDRLTEWMSAKEKERNRRQLAHSGQSGASRLIITRNSPEWFIKKFMDGTVTTRDIESLAVTLRTCAMGWIQSFVEAKGTPVLASFLNGLHAKSSRTENDIALEYEVLKAFRSLFNSKPGANDALAQPKCISGITYSMISAHLATRKQAADILLFLCHWAKPVGHRLVLQGFDDIKASLNDYGRFDAWFRVLEQTIDGRGTLGSRVGASEEVKKLSIAGAQESSLNEYAINNMFLINAILSNDIVSEFEVRVHLRNQMEASGLQRILIKMRAFKSPDLDAQVAAYEVSAAQDHEDVVETFNRDVLTDMSDPVDVFKAVVDKVSGNRAYDFFLSALQHLLLIRQEGDDLVHWYQLIDSLITSVVMDRNGAVERSDISSLLGTSVNNVLSRFADQDHMQSLEADLQRFKTEARNAEQERAKLQAQLEQESEGLVGKLQARISALEEDLQLARENTSAVQNDLIEMEKGYVDRIMQLEVQNREIYEMMRENAGRENLFPEGKTNLDRQQMVDTLEKQLERDRTIRKLEANARKEGKSLPSSRTEMDLAIAAETERANRERISSTVRRGSGIGSQSPSLQGDETLTAPRDRHQSADDSDDSLEPTSEAAKWKIQAALAAGMAQNSAIAERMIDARTNRWNKRSKAAAAEDGGDGQSRSADLEEGEDLDIPEAPPPPPVITSSGPSLLDEIRNRRALRTTASSSMPSATGPTEMGPPPPPAPPPPPPPPPGLTVDSSFGATPAPPAPPAPPPPPSHRSAFSTASSAESSRPESRADSEAPLPPPPPPPPPPPAPGPGVPSTPRDGQRDSMLNVRASFNGEDLAPAGPTSAPPPPPMNGFFGNQMTTRKEVLEMAKTRMKQLQWDKLSPQHAAETVWGKALLQDGELAQVLRSEGLFDEMEEDFKAKQAVKRNTAAAKKEKVEFKTHLSFSTRQGIEMVLKRVKSSLTDSKHATPEEVAHHIVNCNKVVLDQSFLTELLRHYPESETKGQLGEYRNASDEELRLLHPADRLVVLLMTVPHLKEKVKGLLFMTKYKEAYDLVKEGSGKIRDGSEGIVKAVNFAKLLSIVLMMGNYLNATGVQGGAFGFKISSINKLVDTKASDGTTLLHFVERTVSKAFPEVEAFLDELEQPSEACRVQLLDLKRELAELKSGSLTHKKELDRFIDEDEGHLQDPYTKLMLPFLNQAISDLSRLGDQVQYTERVYIDALRYFGEGPDPKRRGFPAAQPMKTEDFFGIFREFSTAYRKIKVDNARISEQRQIEAKRRAAAEEREKERSEALARKEAGVDDSLVLETLLGNLRSGGQTPKHKRKARERGAARRAKESLGSIEGGASQTSAVGAGNPSEMAQAMLAQLQGVSSGGSSGTAAGGGIVSPTTRERPTRRRERRATGERDSLPGTHSTSASTTTTSESTRISTGAASMDSLAPLTTNLRTHETTLSSSPSAPFTTSEGDVKNQEKKSGPVTTPVVRTSLPGATVIGDNEGDPSGDPPPPPPPPVPSKSSPSSPPSSSSSDESYYYPPSPSREIGVEEEPNSHFKSNSNSDSLQAQERSGSGSGSGSGLRALKNGNSRGSLSRVELKEEREGEGEEFIEEGQEEVSGRKRSDRALLVKGVCSTSSAFTPHPPPSGGDGGGGGSGHTSESVYDDEDEDEDIEDVEEQEDEGGEEEDPPPPPFSAQEQARNDQDSLPADQVSTTSTSTIIVASAVGKDDDDEHEEEKVQEVADSTIGSFGAMLDWIDPDSSGFR